MVKKLYVDNYKSLINFELYFKPLNVLIGNNGSGKSSVFEVLWAIRRILVEHEAINQVFKSETLTRWQSRNIQTIELIVNIDDHEYLYHIEIEYDKEKLYNKVKKESVTCDEKVMFDENDGKVRLFDDSFRAVSEIVLDWNYSGVGMVADRRDNRLLASFKKEMEKILICSPRAYQIKEIAYDESRIPDYYFTNAASVFRYLLQEYPEKSKELNDNLAEIFLNHSRVFLTGSGEEKRLCFGSNLSGIEYVYKAHEKSEGELQIFLLYLLAVYYISEGYMVFIDEPDNYISLKEIQPWCIEMEERIAKSGQCVMISHHSEIIDYLAQESGIWISREGETAARVMPPPKTASPLTYSEWLLRGGKL